MPLHFEPAYLLSHYGYIALILLLAGGILGLPVPDEMLMIFCGYLIYLGHINYFPTIASAMIGSMTGMTLSYGMGHYVGIPAINHYGKHVGITEKRLDRVHTWFHRFGKYAITLGYFIPGVRQLTAFLSAVNQISFREFAFYAVPGGLLWVFVFISLGWYLGRDWHKALLFFQHYHLLVIALLVIALLALCLYMYREKTE